MKRDNHGWSFPTRAIHSRQRHQRPNYTPVSTPIYASAWFVYEDAAEIDSVFGGERPGFVYARYGNPTVADLQDVIADLESAEGSVAFGSGMAAVHAAFLTGNLSAGDRVAASRDVYGATYALLSGLFPRMGIKTTFFDPTDRSSMENALAGGARLVVAETVSNPLMKVADIPQMADLAHQAGARLVVDNTFPTPYLFRPLEAGADIVLHSATKYLGGHGDAVGGVASARDPEIVTQLKEMAKLVGGILSPFEAWLIQRGLKTLPVRMERQCAGARRIAEWLEASPRVARVNYPGLASHPQHEVAARMLDHNLFGAMISFEIDGAGYSDVVKFLGALKLCIPGTSLGDVQTLILHPAMSSHRALTPEERASFGIKDNLVRISVGLEDPEDLIADVEQALESAVPSIKR